jgi:hypothetical protein
MPAFPSSQGPNTRRRTAEGGQTARPAGVHGRGDTSTDNQGSHCGGVGVALDSNPRKSRIFA